MSKNTRTNKKKATIVINFILDSSGSMESCKSGTIKGFNQYLDGLREKKENVLFSLTLFNVKTTKRYTFMPIAEVGKLTNANYVPDNGTALWDSAVEATEEMYEHVKKMEVKPTVLTVIMTDGEENSSQEHDRQCLNDLIEKLKGEGNWTFTFLGANQDSWNNASQMGIARGNTVNFSSTNDGMAKSMRSLSYATSNLVASASAGPTGQGISTQDFFAGLKDESDNLK